MALSTRLSRLQVDVPPNARVAGLTVRRGKIELGKGQWGAAVPVDPGTYTVTAQAPGHRQWSRKVVVAAGGAIAKLVVARLERQRKTEKQCPEPVNPTQKIAGIVLSAVGGAVLAAGASAGIYAMVRHSDSLDDGHCNDAGSCDTEGLTIRQQARSAGDAATALLITGGVVLGSALVLVFTAPDEPEVQVMERRSAAVRPSVGVGIGLGQVAFGMRW